MELNNTSETSELQLPQMIVTYIPQEYEDKVWYCF
jgi:hypothetical protein